MLGRMKRKVLMKSYNFSTSEQENRSQFGSYLLQLILLFSANKCKRGEIPDSHLQDKEDSSQGYLLKIA